MSKLLRTELFKIFTRPRTYISFGAVLLIIAAIELGFYFEGEKVLDFLIQNLREKFIFQGKLINNYTVAYVVLNSLWIHVPVLVALVTGDLIAGEANSGTFRLLLTRPVSRTRLLLAKFMAGMTYVSGLLLFMLVFSLLIGHLLFGPGDLLVLRKTINIFDSQDTLWRFLAAYGYGFLSMTTVAAFSFLLSAFAENAIGPIVGTIATIIGITIISTLGFSLLRPILPFLFTTHLPAWGLFFEEQLPVAKLQWAIGVQTASILLFLGTSIVYFRKKDILS